jgi:hypothetical protein
MQVAFESTARIVGGRDDAGARGITSTRTVEAAIAVARRSANSAMRA